MTLFSERTLDFLWGIRFNNNREWFGAHKADYQNDLLAPTTDLAKAVYNAMEDAFTSRGMALHIARIYRDARRLYGRGPFKENLWFSIEQPEGGEKPGFYFSIDPEGYSYGLGFYSASAATMQAYREDLARAPQKALRLAERFAGQTQFVLDGPQYKRPKPLPEELAQTPLAQWYNLRSVCFVHSAAPDPRLFSAQLAQDMVEGFQFLLPYYDWLASIAQRE